jgi:hypothetical protein
VIAEDGRLGDAANEIGALVGGAAVADGVAKAVVDVDLFFAIRLENGAERFVIRVDVAENSQAQGTQRLRAPEPRRQNWFGFEQAQTTNNKPRPANEPATSRDRA